MGKLDRCLGSCGTVRVLDDTQVNSSVEGEKAADDKESECEDPAEGKGKGKAPPPPPSGGSPDGKGKGKGANSVFGRRIRCREVPKEDLHNTVFARQGDEQTALDVERLKRRFGQRPSQRSSLQIGQRQPALVSLLCQKRQQQVLIHLKRWKLSDDVLNAIEYMDLDAKALNSDLCVGLLPAAPSSEEAQLLLNFKDDATKLCEAERLLLPLAQLRAPSARDRLRLSLFRCTLSETTADLRKQLGTFVGAFTTLRDSPAIRVVLRRVLRFVNALNYGVVLAEPHPVEGFALEALAG